MPNNKRKHDRFPISQIFEIQVMKESVFEARGLNISEGGLMCETEYPIEPTARVFIVFKLPHAKPERVVRTEGTVLRVEKKGKMYVFGISYGDISDEDRKAIRVYVKKH
jgi:hypothetical protein